MQGHENRIFLALLTVSASLPFYLPSLCDMPDVVLAALHCLQARTSALLLFSIFLFLLVASVDLEEEDVPSLFIFYHLIPLPSSTPRPPDVLVTLKSTSIRLTTSY